MHPATKVHISLVLVCVLCLSSQVNGDSNAELKFPDDFKFGVASSAYQVEGAWNEDGKGMNMWDRYTHNYPDLFNGSNGDVASDSYHKLKDDIAILKELKVDYYRFSISWSRLMPKGLVNVINPKGVEYYNNLIDELIANNIEPLVTIYHWDMPQSLSDIGGLFNPRFIDLYADYADFLFKTFGDRVKIWTTFNEVKSFCQENLEFAGNTFLPTYPLGLMEYFCANTIVRSHVKVYHLYNDTYKATQGGKVSMVGNLEWDEPATDKAEDVEAAERKRQFDFGLYFNPLVYGNYPQVVIDQIANYSKIQGFNRSRLPEFTEEEIRLNKGTYDFLTLNHYSSWLISNGDGVVNVTHPSFTNDHNGVMMKDPSWPSSSLSWLKVAPKMFRKCLKWLKDTYQDPEIFVTENGYADSGELEDTARINYLKLYLTELLKAIHEDGVRVTRYTQWSLMDSFEWINSYDVRFGLYHIDFNDPNRTRVAKQSVAYYQKIIETHTVPGQ